MQSEASPYNRKPLEMVRLWAHECHRVYLDRLILKEDVDKYMEFLGNGMKEFSDFKPDLILAEPLIYTTLFLLPKVMKLHMLLLRTWTNLETLYKPNLRSTTIKSVQWI